MTDLELLHEYATRGSQPAFAALVERHLDLVYSAARRQVRSAQLAEEIAQSVFVDLARKPQLKPGTPLMAWLFLVTRRTAIDAVRREARRHAQEAAARAIAAMKNEPSPWQHIEPLLDEAIAALNAADRHAVLLRFFENKSLREIGASLGGSENAAQKRVTRALEQLRSFFVRRGIAISAAGLATNLSAHALQSAPAGLSASISTAAFSAPVATAAAAQIVAMTTAQKIFAGTFVAIAVGAALFEAQLLLAQRAELREVTRVNAALATQIGAAGKKNAALDREHAAALREVGAARAPAVLQPRSDPVLEAEIRSWLQRVNRLRQLAASMPEKTIPEMNLLGDEEWFQAAQNSNPDEEQPSPGEMTLRSLRSRAKVRFSLALSAAAAEYVRANGGELPREPRELLPYFTDHAYFKAAAVDEAMLDRYAMRYTGPLADVPAAERGAVFVEITSPDEEHDQRILSGPGGARIRDFKDLTADTQAALRAFAQAKPGATVGQAAELLPYFKPALSPARQSKFLQNAGTLLTR